MKYLLGLIVLLGLCILLGLCVTSFDTVKVLDPGHPPVRKTDTPIQVQVTVPVKPRPAPPKFFTLGGQQWEIVFGNQHFGDGPEEEINEYLKKIGDLGETFCGSRQIIVRTGFILSEERTVILHELLHAEACGRGEGDGEIRYYNSKNEKNHEGIEHIAEFMNDLYHNDPEMVEYLEGQ